MSALSTIVMRGTDASKPGSGFIQGRLYNASDTNKLYIDSGSAWVDTGLGSGGGGSLTSSTAYLGSDVSMTSANTAYDAVSLSLAAGTWLLIANASVKPGANTSQVSAKLWDGSTNASSAETVIAASANSQSVAVQAIVSPGSTTTYKLTCYAADAGATIKAALVSNPAGNTATYLLAIKIA